MNPLAGNPYVWRQKRQWTRGRRRLWAWCRRPWRELSGWQRLGRLLAALLLLAVAAGLVLRPWETTAVMCLISLDSSFALLPAPNRLVVAKCDDAEELLWLSGLPASREVLGRFWCAIWPAAVGGLCGLGWIAAASMSWLHGCGFIPDPLLILIAATSWLAAVAAFSFAGAATLAATIRAPRNLKSHGIPFAILSTLLALSIWIVWTPLEVPDGGGFAWFELILRMHVGLLGVGFLVAAVVVLALSVVGTAASLAIAMRNVRSELDTSSTHVHTPRRIGRGLQTIEPYLGTVRLSPLYQAWRIGALRLAGLMAGCPAARSSRSS